MKNDIETNIAHDDARPLPTLIAELHRAGAGGILTVSSREARRELVFVDGEVRAASSNLEGEKLGSWLVGKKAISIQDKTFGLMTKDSSDSPFGHNLVTRGIINQAELEQQLEELTVSIVERATVQWRTRVDFAPNLQSDQLDTLPNITTPQLIVISARAFPKIELKKELIGAALQQAWLSQDMSTVMADLDLGREEQRLVECLQQPLSLEELMVVTGMDNETFVVALYPLVAAGSVVVGEPTGEEDVILRSGAHPAITEMMARGSVEMTKEQLQERDLVKKTMILTENRLANDILGLSSSASPEQIRESSARLQQIFSPRRVADWHLADLGPQLTVISERVQEASRLLLDTSVDEDLEVEETLQDVVEGEDREVGDGMPTDAEAAAYLERANNALLNGELFVAHSCLEHACDLEPRPESLTKLARVKLFNSNLASGALDKLRTALRLDPGYVDGWLTLADYWRRRRHKERQRKALERAVAASPNHPQAFSQYSRLVGQEAAEQFLVRAMRSRKGASA